MPIAFIAEKSVALFLTIFAGNEASRTAGSPMGRRVRTSTVCSSLTVAFCMSKYIWSLLGAARSGELM